MLGASLPPESAFLMLTTGSSASRTYVRRRQTGRLVTVVLLLLLSFLSKAADAQEACGQSLQIHAIIDHSASVKEVETVDNLIELTTGLHEWLRPGDTLSLYGLPSTPSDRPTLRHFPRDSLLISNAGMRGTMEEYVRELWALGATRSDPHTVIDRIRSEFGTRFGRCPEILLLVTDGSIHPLSSPDPNEAIGILHDDIVELRLRPVYTYAIGFGDTERPAVDNDVRRRAEVAPFYRNKSGGELLQELVQPGRYWLYNDDSVHVGLEFLFLGSRRAIYRETVGFREPPQRDLLRLGISELLVAVEAGTPQ